ncbi:hypothetical protein QQG22_07195 [Staphylococcus aureus]|nr:hypothetical protein QQG22_07195 [Staphylococcus aureus]
MSEPIKEKLELLILKTLKHKENSTSIISNDELEKLFNMYKYLNEPNQKKGLDSRFNPMRSFDLCN